MSRVNDGTGTNFLSADAANLSAAVEEFTFGVWIKIPTGQNGGILSLGASGIGNGRHNLETATFSGDLFANYFIAELGDDAGSDTNVYSLDTWALFIGRRKSDGGGGYIHEMSVNGTWYPAAALTGTVDSHLKADRNNIRLLQTISGTLSFNGKMAHPFIVFEAISDADTTMLANGGNPTALSVADANKYAYYPLTDSSLTNVWADHSIIGALTESGTVTVDTNDNPTVDAPTLPPTTTMNQATVVPGATISGSYENFDGEPSSPLTVLDDHSTPNSATIAVTIDDTLANGKHSGTFTGTVPSLPSSGTLDFTKFTDNWTVRLTDPGA